MSKLLGKLRGKKQSAEEDNNSNTEISPPVYSPPPGPPPHTFPDSKRNHIAAFDPPTESSPSSSVPPPTNPPDNPPPYHDWTSVPDTSLLPPPPPLQSDYSTTTNASYDEAAAAHAWCAQYPVYTPQRPSEPLLNAVIHGQHDIDPPPNFQGICRQLETNLDATNAFGATPTRTWFISSARGADTNPFRRTPPPGDQIFLSRLPLYFAAVSHPLLSHLSPNEHSTSRPPQTIYFEITALAFKSPDATVAIGYVSKPYPPNRQPGWHRASTAVHSDDGRRFTNDSWAGRDFVSSFQLNEPIGLAMTFEQVETQRDTTSVSAHQVRTSLPHCRTKLHFTRNGIIEGSYEIDEERDAERDEGTAGLGGEADMYAAIGVFGEVDVEVRFFGQGEGFVPPPLPPPQQQYSGVRR